MPKAKVQNMLSKKDSNNFSVQKNAYPDPTHKKPNATLKHCKNMTNLIGSNKLILPISTNLPKQINNYKGVTNRKTYKRYRPKIFMRTTYDMKENSLDELTNKFLRGEISREEADELSKKLYASTPEKISEKKTSCSIEYDTAYEEASREILQRITYPPTGSAIKYKICEDSVFIAEAKSRKQNRGGISILIKELEKIARKENLDFLSMKVWETNIDTMEKVDNMGFYEIYREYSPEEDNFLITMQKPIE